MGTVLEVAIAGEVAPEHEACSMQHDGPSPARSRALRHSRF